MFLLVDRSAPFVRSEAGRALVERLRPTATAVVEAAGPTPLLAQAIPMGARMREVVSVGRASTTTVAVTAALVGGADLASLVIRHVGGGANDPWASTLRMDAPPAQRFSAGAGGEGRVSLRTLRVDDAALPHPVFGLVFAAGAASEPVCELLRGEDRRLAGLTRLVGERGWRDGGAGWRPEEWGCDGVPLRGDATFAVASLAAMELGPLRLDGQRSDGIEALSGTIPGGRDALRWATGGTPPWQKRSVTQLHADTPSAWSLDGWSPEPGGARSIRVMRGPEVTFGR